MHPLFDILASALDESESPFPVLEALGFDIRVVSWEDYPELDPEDDGDKLVREWEPNPKPGFTLIAKYWTVDADLIALFVCPTTRAARALLDGFGSGVAFERLVKEVGDTEFTLGYLTACQNLVVMYDQPTMAQGLLRETGISMDTFLAAQKESGYETMAMNKLIRDALEPVTA